MQGSPKDASPAKFAIETAEALGKRMGKREASLLVATIGSDLGRLEQEMHKLATYAGEEPEITAAHIGEATAQLAEAVVWDLTAGLAVGDPDLTLTALQRLQQGGDDPRKLLGLVTWQMREILRATEMLRQGATDAQVTSEVRLRTQVVRTLRHHLGRDTARASAVLARHLHREPPHE